MELLQFLIILAGNMKALENILYFIIIFYIIGLCYGIYLSNNCVHSIEKSNIENSYLKNIEKRKVQDYFYFIPLDAEEAITLNLENNTRLNIFRHQKKAWKFFNDTERIFITGKIEYEIIPNRSNPIYLKINEKILVSKTETMQGYKSWINSSIIYVLILIILLPINFLLFKKLKSKGVKF